MPSGIGAFKRSGACCGQAIVSSSPTQLKKRPQRERKEVAMSSILSAPERGKWGDKRYRGNCSGYIYQALFSWLKPTIFIDPTAGSGTSLEVAREMGITAYGLDLRDGFNALRQSIYRAVGTLADFVLSHPPYGDMIVYSGEVWGDKPVAGDLSRLPQEAFLEALQTLLLNQRNATKVGGHYGTLLGDLRRKGTYTSFQADAIQGMPKDELVAVLIKTQHNVLSSRTRYTGLTLPRIEHEYILVWQKRDRSGLALVKTLVEQSQQHIRGTWNNIVRLVLLALGGEASLEQIYTLVAKNAPEKLICNTHWQAKIRQTLQRGSEFVSRERGVWMMA
jgi:hypothetical protein